MQWFDVDKQGLAKLLERKGKEFILYELLQNAWDEQTKNVDVALEKTGTRRYQITVKDDNPDGFKNLSDAFTLFAESYKKADANKRGRFNLGEKLVLALCDAAEIITTTGKVVFDEKGRRKSGNRILVGSAFRGVVRMTDAEAKECLAAAARLIPPPTIKTVVNGQELTHRKPVATLTDTPLQTEIADNDGYLRKVTRNTTVEIYEPLSGEPAMLYEMGIPVVETSDRWHVNVLQKVPLNMERDNVTPAYLAKVRSLVVTAMNTELSVEDANSVWVRDALQKHGDTFSAETVQEIARLRFGEKRVSFDPSDPEANALAVTKGYTVVHGPSLSKAEWEAVRRTKAILPAGQVTPSPKPFHPDGKPLKYLPIEKYTPAMRDFCCYATTIARKLMNVDLTVRIANDIGWGCYGAYGKGGLLAVNAARLGHEWFGRDIASINDFLIHEFGHEYEGNHLSEQYYDALTALGGRLSKLALEEPELFEGPWLKGIKIKQLAD